MRLLIVFALSSFSFGVTRTNQLPAPWGAKQAMFDKLDPEMIDAGSQLFFDPILSRNQKISCSTCHMSQHAFSNGEEKAKGLTGVESEYNVPVLFNRIDSALQFWDGRVHSLKEQIYHPLLNKIEMGMNEALILKRLNSSPKYKELFHGTITREKVETALAAFVSSLVSGDSRYDRFVAGESAALNAEELEGRTLFFETYKCNSCHSGPGFTNDALSLRCGSRASAYTKGYKVPTLRNLTLSAPYLHNGKLHTLEEVLEFYDQNNNENGITIKAEDKKKLVTFLKTLEAPVVSYYNRDRKSNGVK